MTATAEKVDIPMITEKQLGMLNVLLSHAGMRDRDEALSWINGVLGLNVGSRKELTLGQASEVIDRLQDGQARLKESPPGVADDFVTIQEAISRVTYDIGRVGVGKLGVNNDQHYKFRGIDDIINAMSPVLAKHKVVIIPWVEKVKTWERPTKSGGIMMYAQLTIDYEIIGPGGDSFRSRMIGLGSDTSDKAINKAKSAAFKYLLGEVFTIPQVGFDDGDADSPQIEPRGQETQHNGQQHHRAASPDPPANPNQDLLEKIAGFAKDAGTDIATFTAKFRAAHNDASIEQMQLAPRAILAGFVRQVEEYRQQDNDEPPRDAHESAPQP